MQNAMVVRVDWALMVRLPEGLELTEGEFAVRQDGETITLLPVRNEHWLDQMATGMDDGWERFSLQDYEGHDPVRDDAG